MSSKFDKYLKEKLHKKNKYEIEAKGKAELKPRHIRRLEKIIKDKYTEDATLNELYELTYRENVELLMQNGTSRFKAFFDKN